MRWSLVKIKIGGVFGLALCFSTEGGPGPRGFAMIGPLTIQFGFEAD
jgi:hypothetical protein